MGVVRQGGQTAVRVIARDVGPGIPDLALALQEGYSTYEGLGLGLPGCRRLMDEFDIESDVGVGTTVTMTKWHTAARSPAGTPQRTQEEKA